MLPPLDLDMKKIETLKSSHHDCVFCDYFPKTFLNDSGFYKPLLCQFNGENLAEVVEYMVLYNKELFSSNLNVEDIKNILMHHMKHHVPPEFLCTIIASLRIHDSNSIFSRTRNFFNC